MKYTKEEARVKKQALTSLQVRAIPPVVKTTGISPTMSMNVPGLQLYVVQLAEKYVPNDITLASALNIAAFNIGITLGSFIGSSVTDTLSVIYTPLFGAIVVIIAIVLILFIRNDRQSVSDVIPEENK